ncbi:hypothetical protein P167DRAFT_598319 [Morchella conica CCBAS932]|uniref:Uncharacterized protein n=1 Tax=Morchella conica CCBAS932 TaxID=1392247 RepID=A0A3N4KAL4_9PEZI|nr:hypothetical protein P167DRAFT_598319 [Morchella conica CCBAS932]
MTSGPESQEPNELSERQVIASASDGLLRSASEKISGKMSQVKRIAVISFEVIVTCVPLLFIILAFCANSLDGKQLSQWGEKLQQVAKYGSTIFPILFASVLGMAIRSIARWRVERGTTLRELELLMGSQTLGSTISTQISTLGFSNDFLLGFGLLVFWLLSPIAAQACLRLVDINQVTTESTGNITYLDMETSTIFLTGDDKTGVPMLESFNSSRIEEDGWISVDAYGVDNNISYVSLIGIPVIGLPKLNLSDEWTNKSLTVLMTIFSLETNYFVFDCSNISIVDPEKNREEYVSSYLYNKTSPSPNTTFFLDTSTPLDRVSTPGLPPRYITFVSNYGVLEDEDDTVLYKSAMINCSVTQSYVELWVECYYELCETRGIRKSTLPHEPPEYTALDNQDHMRFIAKELTYRGVDITTINIEDLWGGTLTEYFLNDPSKVGSFFEYRRDISQLPRDVFTSRFALLFNTYWNAALSPNILIDSKTKNDIAEIVATNPNFDYSDLFKTTNTNATIELTVDRYVRKVWAMAVLMATSCLLLITAIIGTALRWKCVGPNVLGYVSTLLMEPGGCTLDGPERTRAFADTKVGLVAVRDGEGGRVVFSLLPKLSA